MDTFVKYLIAILFPPIGLLVIGKPMHALLCFLLMLTVIGWPIAAIWSVLCVRQQDFEQRISEIKNTKLHNS